MYFGAWLFRSSSCSLFLSLYFLLMGYLLFSGLFLGFVINTALMVLNLVYRFISGTTTLLRKQGYVVKCCSVKI